MREGQRIKFKLLGDWALAEEAVKSLSPALKEAYRQAQRNFGHQIERRVKAHIRDQDLPWAELNYQTVERKGHQEIYQETMSYYHAIKTYSSGPYQISVGVKPGLMKTRDNKNGDSSSVEIATYAAINEFGHTFSNGRRIPKRPLWVPTWNELGGKHGMALAVADSFNRIAKRQRWGKGITVLKTKSNLVNLNKK